MLSLTPEGQGTCMFNHYIYKLHVHIMLWIQKEISIGLLRSIKRYFRIASSNARSVELISSAGAHWVAIESLTGASPTTAAASSAAASISFTANTTHTREPTHASLSSRQTSGQHWSDTLSSRKKFVQYFTFVIISTSTITSADIFSSSERAETASGPSSPSTCHPARTQCGRQTGRVPGGRRSIQPLRTHLQIVSLAQRDGAQGRVRIPQWVPRLQLAPNTHDLITFPVLRQASAVVTVLRKMRREKRDKTLRNWTSSCLEQWRCQWRTDTCQCEQTTPRLWTSKRRRLRKLTRTVRRTSTERLKS